MKTNRHGMSGFCSYQASHGISCLAWQVFLWLLFSPWLWWQHRARRAKAVAALRPRFSRVKLPAPHGVCVFCGKYMDVSENSGFSPPNHPFLIGCSIIFTIHFGGIPLFLETPIWMIGLLWWKTVWDSVDVFLLHPPNGKRKDQWPVAMVRKHGFISRCIFLERFTHFERNLSWNRLFSIEQGEKSNARIAAESILVNNIYVFKATSAVHDSDSRQNMFSVHHRHQGVHS